MSTDQPMTVKLTVGTKASRPPRPRGARWRPAASVECDRVAVLQHRKVAFMSATESARDASELLQNLLVEDRSVTGFLDGLAALAARHMGGQREVLCGILLQQAKKNTVVASSSTEAQRMDELQAGFDEGPCLEAQRTNTLIVVPDIRDENRWPDYMDAVRTHGLHSVVAIPLTLEGTATAAMNFYSRDDDAFDDAEIADAQLYAELAAKALLLALRTAAHSDNAHHRQSAM